jgi:long-chain acyl-CoA synthetase
MDTLVELLEATAHRQPRRLAVVMRLGVRSTRYSYAELEERAHDYARLLLERQVQKGDRVLIWAANQPEWVAAMFGTFLAGGVLVPVDVRSTRDFVERVVSQTEPVLAFAGREQAGLLRALEVPVVDFETARVPHDGRMAPVPLAGEDLAEIIFTSGTTGDPKGVMLTHLNIASNVTAALQVIHVSRDDRMLSLLPLSHMFEQIGGCLAAIAAGAAVYYPTSRQPAALARVMQDWKPTIIIGVPQVLTLFMNGIEREAANQGRLGLLRTLRRVAARLPRRGRRLVFRTVIARFGGALEFVVSGGAAIDPEVQRKWELMGVDVVEGYGTTECAPIVTGTPRHDRRIGSVGIPLPGQQVKIAPDGEVLARGPNVFPGYWRNPDATRAAFDGEWYRTGDLGHVEDGYLYLRGRKKDLIVLPDGQNVYPEDIEAVLCRQRGVRDAVVLGLPLNGDVRVHAVVLEQEEAAAAGAVRSANAVLADRQRIAGVTVWPGEDFPRTHTLKVRKNLVLEYLQGQAHQAVATPPPTATSDPLHRLIAQCTGVDQEIHEQDTLGEDLGLDSLGRVELLSAVEEELGVYVDDTAVDPQTSVAELRAMVNTGERRPKTHSFPTWPRRRPVRWLRRVLFDGIAVPLLRTGYRLEVRGRSRYRAIDQPCLIVSNHNMHLDTALLLRSMPIEFRRKVAVAAAASDIFGSRIRGFGAGLVGNAFPFAKEGSGVRESLENVARMLEEGWHVLIYPEGRLTVLGPMRSFKSGVGLLAVETGATVLPVRIDVLRPGFYEGRWLPHPRGRVRISVGEPLKLEPGMSYSEATARLEEAVRGA